MPKVLCITDLDLQVHGGDGLNKVLPCRCCHLESEDGDLLVVQRLDQADQTRLPVHQEGSSQVTVNGLAADHSEEAALPRSHVDGAQGCPHWRVLRDGEGVLRLAERGDEGIRWHHVDEGRHQRMFRW